MSALVLALLLAAPAAVAQEPPANGESFALFEGLHAATRIHMRVPSGPCEAAAHALAARLIGEFEVAIEPEPRSPDALRILVGAPTEPELLPCAQACGVEPLVGGFRVLGRDYTRAGDALVAVLEDPEHPGRPLCFVLGNDLELVSAYLDGIPRLTRPHLWVYDDGELALECPLALDGHPRVDEASDYFARRAEYFAAGKKNDTEAVSVHVRAMPDRERWRTYGLGLTRVQRRVAGWFGAKEAPLVELFLYEHLADFEWCCGTSAFSLANRLRPRVHVLLAPGMPDDGGAGFARVLARALGGAPAEPWLADGLAVAAAGTWWQRPLDEWVGHLAAGKLLPAVGDVFAPDADERFDEHVLQPVRGLFFLQSVQGIDARRVRAMWKGAKAEPERTATLYARAVRAALESVGGKDTKEEQPEKSPQGQKAQQGQGKPGAKNQKTEKGERAKAPEPRARRGPAPYRHGLALVEDERVGYSARAVAEALAAAHALEPGPDAVSLTVFATTEDPLPPLLPPRAQAVHGSANDLALASTCGAARASELAVLLSLEVLARPTGAWADVMSWTGVDDQDLFWSRYERIAEHYALLAELLGLELFSFGANLREDARTGGKGDEGSHEVFASRQANWEKLIARLRAAYGGGLVFSASSPAEAEVAGFLEKLDYIGLCLDPHELRVTGSSEASELQRVLRYELQQAIDLGVRWNKPLLLVQVGFPSRAESWGRPLVPRGALDLGAQQRFFEALADVLEEKLENRATLRGFFLWNWPLDAARAGALDAGFSLREKPVESALRRLFAR